MQAIEQKNVAAKKLGFGPKELSFISKIGQVTFTNQKIEVNDYSFCEMREEIDVLYKHIAGLNEVFIKTKESYKGNYSS